MLRPRAAFRAWRAGNWRYRRRRAGWGVVLEPRPGVLVDPADYARQLAATGPEETMRMRNDKEVLVIERTILVRADAMYHLGAQQEWFGEQLTGGFVSNIEQRYGGHAEVRTCHAEIGTRPPGGDQGGTACFDEDTGP